jgi:hypothetical protein
MVTLLVVAGHACLTQCLLLWFVSSLFVYCGCYHDISFHLSAVLAAFLYCKMRASLEAADCNYFSLPCVSNVATF